jgi:hypothetical protein
MLLDGAIDKLTAPVNLPVLYLPNNSQHSEYFLQGSLRTDFGDLLVDLLCCLSACFRSVKDLDYMARYPLPLKFAHTPHTQNNTRTQRRVLLETNGPKGKGQMQPPVCYAAHPTCT